jgi:hypothetical protein
VTTITNRGGWNRETTVTTRADRLTAYHVRTFVDHMNAAGVPDDAIVMDLRSMREVLIGLKVITTEAATDPEPRP